VASTSAYVVLGIGVTKTTFFTTKDTGIKCPKGHRPNAGAGKFCGECGGQFRETRDEVPTPDFEAWVRRLGLDPEEAWESLCEYEGGLHVEDKKKVSALYRELVVHNVGGIVSSEDKGTELALGFRIMDQDSEGYSSRRRPNTYDLADLNARAQFLETIAKELKIEFLLPVKLHLSIYWSV
jgi:hypothetical protein